MPVEALQDALLELLRSNEAVHELDHAPGALAGRHNLSAEEINRLVARDMGWMYAQGAHPYILAQVALTLGFDMQEYQRQVRAAAGYEGETDG
jgi:hypothetical protein